MARVPYHCPLQHMTGGINETGQHEKCKLVERVWLLVCQILVARSFVISYKSTSKNAVTKFTLYILLCVLI